MDIRRQRGLQHAAGLLPMPGVQRAEAKARSSPAWLPAEPCTQQHFVTSLNGLCTHVNRSRCACLCQVQTGSAGERQGQRAEQQQKWRLCCKGLGPRQVHAALQAPSTIQLGLAHVACMNVHAATL